MANTFLKKKNWLGIAIVCLLFVFMGFGVYSLVPNKTPQLDLQNQADKIVVEKNLRKMTVYKGKDILAVYKIGLGPSPFGHKERQGDGRTPEGIYKISYKNPHSSYHLSLRISYPNRKDKMSARKRGVNPGGDIMIHGYPNAMPNFVGDFLLKGKDWTQGCVAVSNDEIDFLWKHVQVGTEIELRP